MLKEIRRVDPSRGIVQITTLGERWYQKPITDPNTGLESSFEFRPSTTWVTGKYPKGPQYEFWLKKHGDDADIIKSVAGDHGFKEHLAIGRLNHGEVFKLNDVVYSPLSGELEQLDSEEYAGVCSYLDWWKTEGKSFFEIIGSEFTTWPDAEKLAAETGLPIACFRYAGTVDILARQIAEMEQIRSVHKNWRWGKGSTGIIDIKRSKAIYETHEAQVNAYRVSEGADWNAILQINYKLPKTRRWKFTEVNNDFGLFVTCMDIWRREYDGDKPLEREFPLELKLS